MEFFGNYSTVIPAAQPCCQAPVGPGYGKGQDLQQYSGWTPVWPCPTHSVGGLLA